MITSSFKMLLTISNAIRSPVPLDATLSAQYQILSASAEATGIKRVASRRTRLLLTTILFLLAAAVSSAQEKTRQSKVLQETDDTVRVTTELVQTGVTVLDKQGRFVSGLQREQFELYIDEKPQPISFFENIAAGSSTEATQRKAAREA